MMSIMTNVLFYAHAHVYVQCASAFSMLLMHVLVKKKLPLCPCPHIFNGHRGHGYFCLMCIQMILLNIPQTFYVAKLKRKALISMRLKVLFSTNRQRYISLTHFAQLASNDKWVSSKQIPNGFVEYAWTPLSIPIEFFLTFS